MFKFLGDKLRVIVMKCNDSKDKINPANLSSDVAGEISDLRWEIVKLGRQVIEVDERIGKLREKGFLDDDIVKKIWEYVLAVVSSDNKERTNHDKIFSLWNEFMDRYGFSVFPSV